MKTSLNSALLLLVLLVLFPSRVTAATSDAGIDASGAAGATSEPMLDAGVSNASDDASDATADDVPLKCGGALCDTTTGATTCSLAEGRLATGAALPFGLVLALAIIGIGRRARNVTRKVP